MNNFAARCKDGTIPPPNTNCQLGDLTYPPAIVFLFIGFSNCDIEICGGNSDIWDHRDSTRLVGQPCATLCENLNNPDLATPWNQAGDMVTQQSFLYQVYHDPNNLLVGPHVVIFNGALGAQALSKWDPTPFGYYAQNNDCTFDHSSSLDPECNYIRVLDDLTRNGYTEAQVEAVFLKASTSYPQCDLKLLYCVQSSPAPVKDAYLSERYFGNILRYLKCCKLNADGTSSGNPRYPNLQEVFVSSRIYGGYAKNPTGRTDGCLNPEPFSYEEGFAVQRLIVDQINQVDDGYSGLVDYNTQGTGHAPWVDWGPYLWAAGENFRVDGLNWCNGQNDSKCNLEHDVRFGDLSDSTYWGDFTHPTAAATKKVADQLVTFIGKTTGKQGSPFVTPWIGK